MLTRMQIARLLALSVALWLMATLYIRLLPSALINPVQGSLGFVTTVPAAWLSVWLISSVGKLAVDQLLLGVALVGAAAMMVDGVALRWFPDVYGFDPLALRLGAAWLLWGYGVSLAIALVTVIRPRSRTADYHPTS